MIKFQLTKTIKNHYAKLPKKQRIQLCIAIVLTVMVICSIPAYAWFARQRTMAVMASINAPYTLYLGAGNQESIIYFDMSSIDVGDVGITHKDYLFSVQGSWDITDYYMQLAHTTNIPFRYTIYRVGTNDIRDAAGYNALSEPLQGTTVSYTAHSSNGGVEKGEIRYYTYRKSAVYDSSTNLYGKVMDANDYVNIQNNLGIKDSSNNYYSKTYDSTGTARVQKNAVPLYMQSGMLKKNSDTPSGQDFCDYYILSVDWSGVANISNEKETDMIYITVASPSLVN